MMQLLPSHAAGAALLLLLAAGVGLHQSKAAQLYDAVNLFDWCNAEWSPGAAGVNPCEVLSTSYLAYHEVRTFYVPIPATGVDYDLTVTAVSNAGDVDIRLLAPNGTLLAASSERIGEDVVQVDRTYLKKVPGNYTLMLQAMAPESYYVIRVQTPVGVPRLAPADKAVLSSLASQCCALDDDLLPDSCTRLFAATAANASEEQDLCRQPPNMCDEDGRLTKLVLSGGDRGNLVCSSFPSELGQLGALQVLDWTSNGQVGPLSSVAAALAPLSRTLRRLYLDRNALSGSLGCELVENTTLEVLRLDKNLITGSVPACLFRSSSLRQLSLAGNLLRGSVPALPPGCGLNLVDLSGNGPPLGTTQGNPGMQGPLPDLSRAVNLTHINLKSNSLTGTIPPLPSGVQLLQVSYNQLEGPVPPSLEVAGDLRVLDLSRNFLTGTLPPKVASNPRLAVLRLAGNRLGGLLLGSSWGPNLMDVDLSDNNFTGTDLGELVSRPALLKLNLARNGLAPDIRSLAARLPTNSSLMYFNLSANAVWGELSAAAEGLGRMALFKRLLLPGTDSEEVLLQGSLPPQPLFDISDNDINSTFPLKLLSLLSQLYMASYDYFPLSFKLQPQKPDAWIQCPPSSTDFPPDVNYLDDLQELYDLSCMTVAQQRINISAFRNVTLPRPPKRIAPPRPPPPLPPRPPVRRLPVPPLPGGNSIGSNVPSPSTSSTPSTGGGPAGPSQQSAPPQAGSAANPGGGSNNVAGSDGTAAQGSDVQGQPAASGRAASSPEGGGEAAMKGGGSTGAIAGGVVGGLVVVAGVVAAAVYLHRRNNHRRNMYASKRIPLTFNSAYEAPSEGTASNYGDLQMFEFKVSERPPRHRARLP